MLKRLAENIGKGIVAGAAGTAAMTLSSTLEMKLRRREGSLTPADAATKVLGLELADEESRQRFATLVHWQYGIAWGVMRGILAAAGLSGSAAAVAHFAAVWGSALVMLPSLKVAPPPQEWGAEELAIDALHHAVYAATTGAAYDALDRFG